MSVRGKSSKAGWENDPVEGLRQRAERRLNGEKETQAQADLDADRLIYELKVHQEELKIQNEELRQAHRRTAEALEKYRDLYEFAPIGYITIDADDTIAEVNNKAAEMLGHSKAQLVGQRFRNFIAPDARTDFKSLRNRVFGEGEDQSADLKMTSSRRDFDAQLHARLIDKSHSPLLQIAFLDITARKEAEQAMDQINRLLEQRVRKRTAELQRSQRELQYIAENTINLLERERRKISLDLHDTIAQGLATIKLLLENKLATMGSKESPQLPFSIEQILEIAGQNLNETRRIMNYLRPKMLDEIGFLATLRWHLQEFGRINPEITVHKNIRVSENDLPEELTLVLYRIIQEATHNIGRHSSADRVDISIQQKENLLKLRIADNGDGFNREHPSTDQSQGMGITCMKERADLSGGKFSIDSTGGQGTIVEVIWDLARWQNKDSLHFS